MTARRNELAVWFLEALLIFSGLYALWRLATRPAPRLAPGEPGASRTVPGNGAIALFTAGVWAYLRGWLAALPDRQAGTWR